MRLLIYMNDGSFNFISTHIEPYELYNDLHAHPGFLYVQHTTKFILLT